MCCKTCKENETSKNSIDFPLPPKEENAIYKEAAAFRELSIRLGLPVTFVIDNFPAISEILTWKPTKEVFYP